MADDKNKKFKDELMAMSDDDLETMAGGAPSNAHVKAEVERRRKEAERKAREKATGLNYSNSPK